jgi:hypothetical protein
MKRIAIGTCWVQGIYYLSTGVWPLVSIETFQAVSGNKTDNLPTGHEADHWLVNTVAVLIAADSIVLLFAAWHKQVPSEVAILALGAAAGLTAIDVVYVLRGVIAPIYLADAAMEVPFILLWVC